MFHSGLGTLCSEEEIKIFAQTLNIQTNPVSPFEKMLSCGGDRHEHV